MAAGKRLGRWMPVLWALSSLAGVLVGEGRAMAANTWNYYLRADVLIIPAGAYSMLPQVPSENVLMWGYAKCTDATFATCGAVTTPGPELIASEGDTLNVYVKNGLVAPIASPLMVSEPTSLVIRGQDTPLDPVWVGVNATGGVVSVTATPTAYRPTGDGSSRVRSFTHETAVGTVGTYTWANVKPGTYLYQTGTHPAVQVQMGLFGALRVYPSSSPATPTGPALVGGQAYDDATAGFDREVTLVLSEVDPELHYSIASGRYGTPPPAPPAIALRGQRTSTVDYRPRFFLINGMPGSLLPPFTGLAGAGKKTLLRVLNAGLHERAPTFSNGNASIIAEDGRAFSYVNEGLRSAAPRTQYSFLVAAGQTADAIVTPTQVGNLVLYDRRLALSDGSLPDGGQRATLVVAPSLALAATLNHPVLKWNFKSPDVGPVSRPVWSEGSVHEVSWQPLPHAAALNVELWKGAARVMQLPDPPSSSQGKLTFTVPAGLRPGAYRVRVRAGADEVSTEFTVEGRSTVKGARRAQ
jgi:FtsP/CotA-like multicopper oxidase with cupredoxin domain